MSDYVEYAKVLLSAGVLPIFVEVTLVNGGCEPAVAELLVTEVQAEIAKEQ